MPPRVATAASRGLGAFSVTERVGTFAALSKFGIVLLMLVSAGAGFHGNSAPRGARGMIRMALDPA